MQYRIKEISKEAYMPQRSTDGNEWHDGVPVPAPSLSCAHGYVASMRQFDARDSEGVVVWTSEWKIAEDPKEVASFFDFLV